MIIAIVIFLVFVSVAAALWSLRNAQKMKEVHEAKDDLSKSKILYRSDSLSSSSSSAGKDL